MDTPASLCCPCVQLLIGPARKRRGREAVTHRIGCDEDTLNNHLGVVLSQCLLHLTKEE